MTYMSLLETFVHAGKVFNVQKKIKFGTFGSSFLCSQNSKRFFLRSFDEDQLQDDKIRVWLRNEKSIADLKLKHINILTALCFIQQRSLDGVLNNYMAHGTLEDYIVINGAQCGKVCKLLMKELLEGLSYLDSKNIVHRNITPTSIFMVKGIGSISVKIGKFQSAFILSEEDTFETEEFVGPLHFSAPEIIRKQPYECKADVWSAGCILLYMSTAQKPFKSTGLSREDIFVEITRAPRCHQEILRKTLKIDPDDRPYCSDLLELKYFRIKNLHKLNVATPKSVLNLARSSDGNPLDKTFIINKSTLSAFDDPSRFNISNGMRSKRAEKRKLFESPEPERELNRPKKLMKMQRRKSK